MATAIACTAAILLAGGGSPANADVQEVLVGTQGFEPLLALSPDGTILISALQHLYASTDGGQSFFPVTGPPFAEQANLNSDSSIFFDPAGRLYFTFDWPYAGATAVCVADPPIGPTPNWICDPGAAPAVTDRMWLTAPSPASAYMVTNLGLYETTFFTSFNRGLTWVPSTVASGLLSPQTGPLLKDPTGPQIFQPTKTQNILGFYVYSPSNPAELDSGFRPTSLPGPLALPSAAFSTEGTLWTSSERTNTAGGREVVVARSTNRGLNWTNLPIPGTQTGTGAFSWVSAGEPGHVGVIYYYTTANGAPGNLSGATWDARWTESFNADEPSPLWKSTTLETGVHNGVLCIALGCEGSGRYSGDNICSLIGPDGSAHVTWMRDTGGPARILYARLPQP